MVGAPGGMDGARRVDWGVGGVLGFDFFGQTVLDEVFDEGFQVSP
jgi:hypothetical protein